MAGVPEEQLRPLAPPRRRQRLQGGEIGAIHREQQVEALELLALDLARGSGGSPV
jgi:hypothetical protein